MKQILHIFRKDTRRFWPEILISVVIQFAYVAVYPNQWRIFHDPSERQRMLTLLVSLGTLLVAGWGLLIARVVHEETLVGDRQFWITRPYAWKELLGAKVFFVVAWIGLPYLLAQMLLLAEAKFVPLDYLPGLLVNLLVMSTIFLVPVFALASVTANFARLTLTVLGCLVIFVGYMLLTTGVQSGYTSVNPYTNVVWLPLLFCGCAVAIALQYATRRVWVSRGLLIALPILMALSAVAYRRQSLVDKAYPQPAAGAAPVLAIAHTPSNNFPDKARMWEGEDYIDLPIHFSDVAGGYAVFASDFRFTITAADGSEWTSPWQQTRERLLPGDHGGIVSLMIKPELYDRFKTGPVTLRVTFAVSRYQADTVENVTFPAHEEAIPGIGYCAEDYGFVDNVRCREAVRQAKLTYAAVVWSKAPCSGTPPPADATARGGGWLEPTGMDFALNSVWTPYLFLYNDEEGRNRHWTVCPGSAMTVTQYHLVDRTRAELTMTNFQLPATVVPTS